jgi:hypothetical protein
VNCFFCRKRIRRTQVLNMHHPVYKSRGGVETEPAHKTCHVQHHKDENDFQRWGRQGGITAAATFVWALNLKGVREHPAYEMHRAAYRLMNSSPEGNK